MANPVRAEQTLGITALGREPVDQSKSAVAKAFYRIFMKLTHDQPYFLVTVRSCLIKPLSYV